MATSNDRQTEVSGVNPTNELLRAAPRRVLVVDTDPVLFGLLQEWLGECGCIAVGVSAGVARNDDRFDLVIVDIPVPRQGGAELVTRIANQHPGVPILALSSCFFASIPCQGEVARALGVASALPKPVSHDVLQSAVRALLKP